jgi:DNA (cytosine-5)-methyltransferase 1
VTDSELMRRCRLLPLVVSTSGKLRPLAVEHYDEQRAQQVLAFLKEYCGPNSTGLVDIDGTAYRIVDIGMRMLQPHELYRAQGS